MNIANKIAQSTDNLFMPFEFRIDPSVIIYAKCIAFTNFGGDDTRSVYELHVDNEPRFFALSILEYPEDETIEIENTQRWTEASEVKLIEKRETDYLDFYLFELTSPFGISFSKE